MPSPEFRQPLETGDREEAIRRRPMCELRFNAEVDKARAGLNEKTKRELIEHEAVLLAAQWFTGRTKKARPV